MAGPAKPEDPVVITSAARTPIGSFLGSLAAVPATRLGALALGSAVPDEVASSVDEVIMGNVLSAGLGQNPARQAALGAGLGQNVPATTVSKVCGSGLKAAALGYDSIVAGTNRIVAAGGMESMSNAPYLLPKARTGLRIGHHELRDHMYSDGLEDAYEGRLMGAYAEETAQAYQFTREMQDAYAMESLHRAKKAIANGAFDREVTGIDEALPKGRAVLQLDEQPGRVASTKIPTLPPAFGAGGTITAASSSSISDGAAALLLMRSSEADRHGLGPLVRIVGHASYADEPAKFTTAPVGALRALLEKVAWKISDVDLYEINEAFAVVVLVAIHDLGLPADIVNVNGGACALGHPIGASGARILVTLIHAMIARGAKRGIASICIGGGEAMALAVERAT